MIKETLEEINLLEAINSKKLMVGDIYKVLGAPVHPVYYFYGYKVEPIERPNLFGAIIYPKQKRDVVCLQHMNPKRMKFGKGFFLDNLGEKKFFLVHEQINTDTNEVLYSRDQRMKKEI